VRTIDASRRRRIIVSGYAGLLHTGGVTWDYLQYPLGFAGLGHDVYYVEDTHLWPVYQQATGNAADCSANVSHLADAMASFGMADRWCYRDAASARSFGMSASRVQEVLRTADLFVNVSCATPISDEYARIPARLLIDSDPMFTQLQLVNDEGFTKGAGAMRALVAAHTHHFTSGVEIVHTEDVVAVLEETFAEVRTDEPGTAGDEHSLGGGHCTVLSSGETVRVGSHRDDRSRRRDRGAGALPIQRIVTPHRTNSKLACKRPSSDGKPYALPGRPTRNFRFVRRPFSTSAIGRNVSHRLP
jgi:hypothetical protein